MKHSLSKFESGFTIVELVVVIAVVAILAAVTIISYQGIQNKAYDSTVQKDLQDMSKQFEIFRSRHMYYPETVADLASLEAKPSRDAYMTSGIAYNFIPCTTSDSTKYTIAAVSNSGAHFYVTDNSNVQEYTGASNWATTGSNFSIMCTSTLSGSSVIPGGVGVLNGNWRPWTKL